MNASREPDYKGIELKSFRSQRPNIKKNLFCKVPDWDISYLKSGAEIVEKYGYLSGGVKSYRNTLYCKAPNSQSLRLNMNYPDNLLEIEEDRKIAEDVYKTHAICVRCGDLAYVSHRLVANEKRVLLGETDSYEPLCRHCYEQAIAQQAAE